VIEVPAAIVESTFEALIQCGRGWSECVVFWTGPTGSASVDQVVHARHERSPTHYTVDDKWLNQFWFGLGTERRSIKAQIHTHPGIAFHSATDDVGAVAVHDGFLSIVIPYCAVRRSLAGARAYVIMRSGWQLVPTLDKLVRVKL